MQAPISCGLKSSFFAAEIHRLNAVSFFSEIYLVSTPVFDSIESMSHSGLSIFKSEVSLFSTLAGN